MLYELLSILFVASDLRTLPHSARTGEKRQIGIWASSVFATDTDFLWPKTVESLITFNHTWNSHTQNDSPTNITASFFCIYLMNFVFKTHQILPKEFHVLNLCDAMISQNPPIIAQKLPVLFKSMWCNNFAKSSKYCPKTASFVQSYRRRPTGSRSSRRRLLRKARSLQPLALIWFAGKKYILYQKENSNMSG